MAMTVVCPACSRKLNVPDHLVGELVKCPVCGQNFKVDVEHEPTPEVQPVQPQPQAPPEVESLDKNEKDQDAPAWQFAPGRRRDFEPHRGTLILVLGILSIILTGPGIILGLVAWIMGTGDLKAMRQGRMDPMGEATTKAGYVCGVIGTCLHLIGFCSCCGFTGLHRVLH